MKLTKYEHACFTVEKDGKVLVVDPGGYTTDFIAPEAVVAVVITHIHGDHFDHDLLDSIIDKNPGALIIGPEDVVKQIEAFETRSVDAGDSIEVGGFNLEFFGGQHAVVHPSLPVAQNVGVLINDLIYYPGDSFAIPEGREVDTLALPVAGPWMKISEAIDFALKVKPRFMFPTHDAVLSDVGRALADGTVPKLVAEPDYRRIDGQTIEV
jgi:L-ascorbate metabolism protein UlaG (beta-lactamase superfamily)